MKNKNELLDKQNKNVTFEEFDKMIENKEVVPTINPSYNLLKNYYDVYMKGKMLK